MEKYVSFTPYQYGLLNPVKLFDANGKEIFLSSDAGVRNEQLEYFRMMVGPEYSKYINGVSNSNGEFVLDKELLNSGIKEPEKLSDENVRNLVVVANDNEAVQLELKEYNEPFHDNQKITFKDIEDLTDKKAYGFTLVSNNITVPEPPKLFSVTGKNVMYINRLYGEKEGVKSLAHELLHVYLYITRKKWGDKNSGMKKKTDKAEENAGKAYDKYKEDFLKKLINHKI